MEPLEITGVKITRGTCYKSIAVAAGDIAQDRRMLSRLQESLLVRCKICIEAGDSHFEQLL